MKIGQCCIAFDDLAAWLRLPPGHRVTAIVTQDAPDIANRRIRVLIEGPLVPEHYEGASPMLVPIIRDTSGKTYFIQE